MIGFAHAGMTAEGDNSVLIQKVTKELTTDIMQGKKELNKMTMCPTRQLAKLESIDNIEVLINFVTYKQNKLIEELNNRMTEKVLNQGQKLFDVWMTQESDLIQEVGKGYGEEMVLNVCLNLAKTGKLGSVNHKLMEKIVILYGLTLIEKDLSWYMMNNVISEKAASELNNVRSKYVKEIALNTTDIVDGFDINPVYAPIAEDYLKYNETTNNGELGPKPRL